MPIPFAAVDAAILAVSLLAANASVLTQAPATGTQGAAAAASLTYSDLADLADPATIVAHVQVVQAVRLAPGQRAAASHGSARVYIEAKTKALLIGEQLGDSVRYLAEVPLDARGRLPSLRRREMLLFARPVPGRPGELQLVAPDAQLAWSPERRRASLASERRCTSAAISPAKARPRSSWPRKAARRSR